ncbi:hypothetical protein BEWA_017300 [Theileria equi strain WA]|uniref:Exportin-1/Importin-beta-like domain-containing protein n=1 Tax=Theileria equi strain WA TaxID=1537102 RepID=L1L972_THEEQ|nr:hypothetical protein BEWA_017300 [Theileria equi strain WA]EKX72051.1 hypothetical protein BEWA_017300 [Theileria equi strain WA]|eukprot:XP_004831503.1 hypothetical protein BEWA_017300 [Theileria equi strain WA]
MADTSIESLEHDIIKLYSNSSEISDLQECLKDFQESEESWEVCTRMLERYSTAISDNSIEAVLPLLLYSTSTLRYHAYNGFKHHLKHCVGEELHKLWDICEHMMELLSIYSHGPRTISTQLSCVAATAIIFAYDATLTESELLLLAAINKTVEGSVAHYLLISSVVEESFNDNILISLEHRSSFIRSCAMISPRIFERLFSTSYDMSVETLRINALSDWISLHFRLLRRFGGFRMEQSFFDKNDRIYEDSLMSRLPKDDCTLVFNSLNALYALNIIKVIFDFIKFGIATNDHTIIEPSCNALVQLLALCQIDLPTLLIVATNNQPPSSRGSDAWKNSCRKALSNLATIISTMVMESVDAFAAILEPIVKCAEMEKSIGFLPYQISKTLLSTLVIMSAEHLPFSLYFDPESRPKIEHVCNFVNLFLFGSSFELRELVLDFWASFQSHFLPTRRDISISNTSITENMRLTTISSLRPLYELFLINLYRSVSVNNFENQDYLETYNELVSVSMREASLLTGPEYILKLVNDDLPHLSKGTNWKILERSAFSIYSVASLLTAGRDNIVRKILLIATDSIKFREIISLDPSKASSVQRTISKLILWTCAFIAKDQKLYINTYNLLFNEIIANNYMDIITDQAIVGLCYCIDAKKSEEDFVKMMKYLITSITESKSMIDLRIEMVEAILDLLTRVSEPTRSILWKEMLDISSNRIKDMLLTEMTEDFKLFILIVMSLNNFHGNSGYRHDVSSDIMILLKRVNLLSNFWEFLAKVYGQVVFIDEPDLGATKPQNEFMKNRVSLLVWLFNNTKRGEFFHLGLIKVLLVKKYVVSNTRLFSRMFDSLTSIYSDIDVLLSKNQNLMEDHLADVLECTREIFGNWEFANKLLEWEGICNFITSLISALPMEYPDVNNLAFLVLAKFVGWADLPKELYMNTDADFIAVIKSSKSIVRSLLNSSIKNSKNRTLIYVIINTVITCTISKPCQMDSWIPSTAQILSVLLTCNATSQNANISLKTILTASCKSISPLEIRYYYRKIVSSGGAREIAFLLRSLSDYYRSKSVSEELD